MSTVDIDCIDENDALMNEIINTVGDKYNLPIGWINTEFLTTRSYSPKLIQYSSFYKNYLNDVLVIRTIKDEYLIAMKMVSARKYKNDYSDIYGIIKENPKLSIESILTAIKELYGESIDIDEDMKNYVNTIFTDSFIDYNQLKENEKAEKESLILKTKNSKKL